MKADPQSVHKPEKQSPLINSELQRAAINEAPVTDVPPIVHEVLRSPGQPLDTETHAFFEPRFGHDFSGVRVHTDEQAAESAQAVNAQAFTAGKHIVFDHSNCSTQSGEGKNIFAHELVHVLQQHHGATGIYRLESKKDVKKRSDIEKEWSASHPEGRVFRYSPGRLLLWNFDVASAKLKPEHQTELEDIIRLWNIARLHPDSKIIVSGNASKTGDHQQNERFSQMRAAAVEDYLKNRGVASSHIHKTWYGDTRPQAARLLLGRGMAEDRSVEVRIVGYGGKHQEATEIPLPEQDPTIIDEHAENARKFATDKPKEVLPEWVEKGKAIVTAPGISEVIPGVGEIIELIDILTLGTVRDVIAEVHHAQTINERYAQAAAIAYTIVSYGIDKTMAELPPNYFAVEPEAREKWDEVALKAWLSLDIDAMNNPKWNAIEAYIKKNPEKVLNDVYRKIGTEYDLGPLKGIHLAWPIPTVPKAKPSE